MANQFNFAQVQQKLIRAKREILVLLPNQAQNYFVSSWQKQGFDGKQWDEVQRRKPGFNAYKYPKSRGLQRRTQPILIGAGWNRRGGTLRRAVSMMSRTARVQTDGFRMVVDLDYATYLNEGTKNMPKRQFVGQTAELTAMQERKINEIITRIF